ncbi:xanthine dehydrogenase family protein molybdopterin-binding subunit [Hominiventricola filiformis]|uniref:Molybdopterin-dependent oxidoreductase n=1 Tax=Hominiventricola filiformis TaxID=2885352 RepID=A0AAE3A8L5_9FIRM|nr:molybdopterin cofactor-binding domain-containing protein [Hominiventricola filiformis]MCC2125160.1 molybdopterin-dependent oxidoreductase [Hominiventricola filiformis]
MKEFERDRKDYHAVGKCIPKKDSEQLLLGKPVFMDDIVHEDCLVVKILRSPHAHALIEDINTAAAMKVPGIVAVYTWKDVPQNRFSIAGQTFPEPSPYDRLILDQRVRSVGDAVAIVAGETEKAVDKALRVIKVKYQVLEPVLDFRKALDNPVLVHPEDNWMSHGNTGDVKKNLIHHEEDAHGDVEAVLADCEEVIEHTYRIKAAQQGYMETIRAYCEIDRYGRLHCISSTQIVFHLRRILATALGIPKSKVRAEKPRIGGGFGAKQTAVCEVYPAFVTWMTKRPSKIIYSRRECQTIASPRHEMEVTVRLGAMKDGRIRAIDLYTLSNGGAYGEHSTTTVGLSGHKAIPLYTGGCEATRFSCDVVYTNVQAAGAYRGYGATQGIFALESTVNELAEKLHMDPVELRMKNIVREGMFMPAYFGETANACALDRCIEHCADNFHWKEKYPVRDMGNGKVRASGMAIAMQGSCISNVDVGSCTLKLSDEGTYNMMIGAADMGTGCDTILAQMAAEVLDCEPDQIVVFGADTDASPYDSGSYASSTTYITGMATQNAAMELRGNIMKIGAQLLECLPEEVEFDGEKVYLVNGDKSVSLADIATKSQVNNLIPVDVTATYSSPVSPPPYMVGMVEIELDKETGSVEILDYEAVVDCGIPVNPNLARVQTEGGIGQGIGMALYENVSYNANGKIAEGDFMQYKIPTRQDVGNIHVEFETSYEPSGPFGVKSIGEIVINTPAPALAHAIYRATGVWHRTVPFTPEKILMGMIDPEWKETDHRVKE